jgi:hypothetical protein
MVIKTIKENGSVIEIYSDNTVRKNYVKKSRNEKEYHSLMKMQSVFEKKEHNEWSYDLVHVLKGTKEDGFLMNMVPGISMMDDPLFGKDHYYHAGLWLGHFHRLTRGDMQVNSFGDFTFSNIFISHKDKIVTALDPDGRAMAPENYYADIIVFFNNIIMNHLRQDYLYDKDCVHEFIKGYNMYGSFEFNKNYFDQNVNEVISRFKTLTKRKHGKWKSFLGSYLVAFYFKYHLKNTLKKYI